MLSLPYDKPASVGTTFDVEHDGSYQLDLEMAVKGEADKDSRKCRVVFKLDNQVLVEKKFGWYENKTFPFLFDEKLPVGTHNLTCELQPLNPDAKGTNTLALRIVSVTVRGPLDKKYWTRPKNFRPLFHKGRAQRPRRPASICGGTFAQLRHQGIPPSGG